MLVYGLNIGFRDSLLHFDAYYNPALTYLAFHIFQRKERWS